MLDTQPQYISRGLMAAQPAARATQLTRAPASRGRLLHLMPINDVSCPSLPGDVVFHIHLVHPSPVLACTCSCLACLVLPTVLLYCPYTLQPMLVICIVLCFALHTLYCICEYLPHCAYVLCFAFPCSWLRVTYVGSAICRLGDQVYNTLRL